MAGGRAAAGRVGSLRMDRLNVTDVAHGSSPSSFSVGVKDLIYKERHSAGLSNEPVESPPTDWAWRKLKPKHVICYGDHVYLSTLRGSNPECYLNFSESVYVREDQKCLKRIAHIGGHGHTTGNARLGYHLRLAPGAIRYENRLWKNTKVSLFKEKGWRPYLESLYIDRYSSNQEFVVIPTSFEKLSEPVLYGEQFYLVTSSPNDEESEHFYLHLTEDVQVTLKSGGLLSDHSIMWRFISYDDVEDRKGCLTSRQLVYLQAANGYIVGADESGGVITLRDIPLGTPAYVKETFTVTRAGFGCANIWWTDSFVSDATVPLPIEFSLPELFADTTNYDPEVYEMALTHSGTLRLGVQEILLVEDALQCLMGVQGEFVKYELTVDDEGLPTYSHSYRTLAQRLPNAPPAPSVYRFDSVDALDESLRKMMSKIMEIVHTINMIRLVASWHLDDPESQINCCLGNCVRNVLFEFERRVCDINSWNERQPMSLQKLYAVLETLKPIINLLENVCRATYGKVGVVIIDLIHDVYHDSLRVNVKKLFNHILRAVYQPLERYLSNWLRFGVLDRDLFNEFCIIRNLRFGVDVLRDKQSRRYRFLKYQDRLVDDWLAWKYEYVLADDLICRNLKPFAARMLEVGKAQILLERLRNNLQDMLINSSGRPDGARELATLPEYPRLNLTDSGALDECLTNIERIVNDQLNDFLFNNKLVVEDLSTQRERRQVNLREVLLSIKELYFVKRVDVLEDMFVADDRLDEFLTSSDDKSLSAIQAAWERALKSSTHWRDTFLLPVQLIASKLPLSMISEMYYGSDDVGSAPACSAQTFSDITGLRIGRSDLVSFIDAVHNSHVRGSDLPLSTPVFEDRNLLRLTYHPYGIPFPVARLILDAEALLILQSIFRLLFTITNLIFRLESIWSQIYHARHEAVEDALLSIAAQSRALFVNVIKSIGDYVTDEVLPNRDSAMTAILEESNDYQTIKREWKSNLVALGYELFLNDTTVQQHLSGIFKITQSFTFHVQRLIDYEAVKEDLPCVQQNVRLIENMDHSFRCVLMALVDQLKLLAQSDGGRAPSLLARLQLSVDPDQSGCGF